MRSSFALLLFTVMTCGTVAAVACDPPQTEPPAETPKSARPRSADRTEVTMEVSSAAVPPEASPSPNTPAASASSAASPSASATPSSDPSEDPTIGGPQSDPTIESAVAPVRPRLRACYKKALSTEPNLGGSATFDVTVGKAGHAAAARFVKRDGLNEDMVGCLLAAVKTMTFDPARKSQIVTLSFGTGGPSTGADAGAKH